MQIKGDKETNLALASENAKLWMQLNTSWLRKKLMKKKVYLAGPMRGLQNYNFPMFYQTAAMLEMMGYSVFNPAKLDIEDGRAEWNWNTNGVIIDNSFTIEKALARDFKVILDSDAIILLPGWKKSKGAQKELEFALAIGLKAFEYTGDPINIDRDEPMEFD